jgi:alpha-tubulin suppressor-like RCC1 family protein
MKAPILLGLIFMLVIWHCRAQSIKKVEAGGLYTIILKSDGTLWASGKNRECEFGSGDTVSTNYFIRVGKDSDWADIAAGSYHALALKRNGTLWGWGSNYHKEVHGLASNLIFYPAEISQDTDWIAIEAGATNSFALKRNHTLWAWGYNSAGQLGDSSLITSAQPTLITGKWLKVSAGYAFTIALSTDSTLWSWGDNSVGQLGNGISKSSLIPVQVNRSKWLDISAGFGFAIGIKKDHSLWSWGYNGNGQLGLADTIKFVRNPVQVGKDKNWEKVYAGPVYSFALKQNQFLYAWGFNNDGQLGLGNTATQYTPQLVSKDTDRIDISPARPVYINGAVYGSHTFCLKRNGNLCATGWNHYGQLGTHNYTSCNTFFCDIPVIIQASKTEIKK